MTGAVTTFHWGYFIVQIITLYNIASSGTTSSNLLFTSPVHLEDNLNNSSANRASLVNHHPNLTYFTRHGTIESPEDNILSKEKQTASAIFLHGLGSTGKKMRDAILFLKPNHQFRHIKLIFPTAPLLPYTPDNGNLNRAWFDKMSNNSFSPEEPNTLAKSIEDIKELIQREVALGIPLYRIIIGGFSQGGAMALNVIYRSFVENETLAGVFALSAYLHGNSSLYEVLHEKNLENAPPLYYIHGKNDEIVLHEWGNQTFERLKSFGIRGEFTSQRRLKHRISTKGLHMLFEWLERTLPYDIFSTK